MKRFILCMISVLAATGIFAQQRGMKPVQVTVEGSVTTLYKQSHALLIGVSKYNMGLPPLPGVAGDIDRIQKALETNGFDVTIVMNPNATALQQAFNSFITQYGQDADNRLLIYFAGHGYTKKMSYGEEIGYICPVDAPNPQTDFASFQAKAMPMGQIEIYAKQISSKHALFLFDACFSGSIFSTSRAIPEIISYKSTQPVRQFITSGSAEETVPDKSIFQSQLIRALNGEADANKDGFVTGTELGDYLQSTVVNYSNGAQHPQYGKIRNPNLDKGDFIFIIGQADRVAEPSISIPATEASVNKQAGPAVVQFRWRYRSGSGTWGKWETTGRYDSNKKQILLWSAKHAGDIGFYDKCTPDGKYTAYITWTNSAHSLFSADDYGSGQLASEVSLKVEYLKEVANPETFYLAVERKLAG